LNARTAPGSVCCCAAVVAARRLVTIRPFPGQGFGRRTLVVCGLARKTAVWNQAGSNRCLPLPRGRPYAPAEKAGLDFFRCFDQPRGDDRQRGQQRDPDADSAPVGGKELVRDPDQAHEHEDRCQDSDPDPIRLSGRLAGSAIPNIRSANRTSTAKPRKKTSWPTRPVCQPMTLSTSG